MSHVSFAGTGSYSCVSANPDKTVLSQIVSQMQFKQKQIDDGTAAQQKSKDTLLIELTALQKTKSEIENCFIIRGESVPDFTFEVSREVNPSPTFTPLSSSNPIASQVQIISDLIVSIQKNSDDLKQAKIRTLSTFPQIRNANGEIIDPVSGLTQKEIDEKIDACRDEIIQLQKTINDINTGYNNQNFACDAVCDHEEERMKHLLNDTNCNNIPQCKDCRTAFLSTVAPNSTTGAIGSGAIGILGDTCGGYRSAKTSTQTNLKISEKWRSTANLCALVMLPFVGGAICFADMEDTASDAKALLGDWEKKNSEMILRVATAFNEMGSYETLSDYSKISTVNFLEGVGSIAFPIIGAMISNGKANKAFRLAMDTEMTSKKVCTFITDYSMNSAKNNANVLACTVYAGYLMSKGNQNGNQNIPDLNALNKVTSIKDNNFSSQNYTLSKCGNLTGALCKSIETALSAKTSPSKLSQIVKDLSISPQKAALLSQQSNTLSSLKPDATLGEKMKALNPELSSKSVQTFNEFEKSIQNAVKERNLIESETSSLASTSGSNISSSNNNLKNTDATGFMNQQNLVFLTPESLFRKPSSQILTPTERPLKDDVIQSSNDSIFKIINEVTLRKQKMSEVITLSPLLKKNGGIYSEESTRTSVIRSLSSETPLSEAHKSSIIPEKSKSISTPLRPNKTKTNGLQ